MLWLFNLLLRTLIIACAVTFWFKFAVLVLGYSDMFPTKTVFINTIFIYLFIWKPLRGFMWIMGH